MTRFLGKTLWTELQRLLQTGGRLTVVAPYYSDDSRVRCAAGDTIIVDASEGAIAGGQTSARVLIAAEARGATILHHQHLHAKIVLGTTFAVVSSANFSQSSLKLREAGVLLSAPASVQNVAAYVDELRAEAVQLSSARLEALASIPVRPAWRFGTKPSLLQALADNLLILHDLTFGFSPRARGRVEPRYSARALVVATQD